MPQSSFATTPGAMPYIDRNMHTPLAEPEVEVRQAARFQQVLRP
jgi:hypothetical protein